MSVYGLSHLPCSPYSVHIIWPGLLALLLGLFDELGDGVIRCFLFMAFCSSLCASCMINSPQVILLLSASNASSQNKLIDGLMHHIIKTIHEATKIGGLKKENCVKFQNWFKNEISPQFHFYSGETTPMGDNPPKDHQVRWWLMMNADQLNQNEKGYADTQKAQAMEVRQQIQAFLYAPGTLPKSILILFVQIVQMISLLLPFLEIERRTYLVYSDTLYAYAGAGLDRKVLVPVHGPRRGRHCVAAAE